MVNEKDFAIHARIFVICLAVAAENRNNEVIFAFRAPRCVNNATIFANRFICSKLEDMAPKCA